MEHLDFILNMKYIEYMSVPIGICLLAIIYIICKIVEKWRGRKK